MNLNIRWDNAIKMDVNEEDGLASHDHSAISSILDILICGIENKWNWR